MNRSLTVVLPVHNAEKTLRTSVRDMLELAAELTNEFRILIVDDGSNDDTYEVASELAARFPQVATLRHAQRRGLGRAISSIRKHVRSDVVVVHDGVTPIDANQVRRLWHRADSSESLRHDDTSGPLDVLRLSSTHEALEAAHRRVIGFHLVSMSDDVATTNSLLADERDSRQSGRRGVGNIPPLPRPKFLEMITDFALGE